MLIAIGILTFALIEYYKMAKNKGFEPSTTSGITVSVAYLLALGLSFYYPDKLQSFPSLVLLVSLVILFLPFFSQKESALGNVAVTLFAIIYITLPIGFGLRINYFFQENELQDGRLWFAYVLLVTKMTDIGAYFCGKLFGKRKLAPSISPKKTIEGSFGGLLASLFTSLIFSLIASNLTFFKMTIFQSIWIGIVISILAQIGDLSESLLKRDAGIKDSSHLPGLGGILDIVDSLVFTFPFVYFMLKMKIVG